MSQFPARWTPIRRLLIAASLVSAMACGGGGGDATVAPPPAPTVQSVTVTPATATLTAVGQTTTLAAEVRLSNGTVGSQTPTWNTSNAAVATVSAAGVVTAVASGQATITATVNGLSGQALVTVNIPVVQAISVSPSNATLTAVGQTATLSAEVRLSNGALGTQVPTWSTSNATVATVSATGVVTAVASGQATITATVGTVSGQAAIVVAIPVVQTVTILPATATLTSLGATTALVATVRLSNGATSNATPTWRSANAAVATVNANGNVTAVGNGTTTITASVGDVSGATTITVAQTVTSVRLLPLDTVTKRAMQLRGAALDARGNVVANAPLQYTSLTPAVATVSGTGAFTPVRMGVARVQVSSGTLSASALVRTIGAMSSQFDLAPLFEFSASAGPRRVFSDVSQNHADARAVVVGRTWSYLETVFPRSGSLNTDFYFTAWPDIWLEVSPYCGGIIVPNSTIYQACNSPAWNHWLVPGQTADDQDLIIRWLTRQFILSSMTTAGQFPWFVAGYSLWLSGGTFEGSNLVVAAPRRVFIQDFRTGDSQNLLLPLDTLVRTPSSVFNSDVLQRTPTAVRQAQSALFIAFLNRFYPNVMPAVLARIRATPGATFDNTALIEEIEIRAGRSMAQLQPEYLAYARSLTP